VLTGGQVEARWSPGGKGGVQNKETTTKDLTRPWADGPAN